MRRRRGLLWKWRNWRARRCFKEDWKRDASNTACGETPQPRGAGTGGRAAVLKRLEIGRFHGLQGLKIFTSAGKSAVLRVTTVSSCTSAVAAMRLSITSMLNPTASCLA
jgi:hypothetical protein